MICKLKLTRALESFQMAQHCQSKIIVELILIFDITCSVPKWICLSICFPKIQIIRIRLSCKIYTARSFSVFVFKAFHAIGSINFNWANIVLKCCYVVAYRVHNIYWAGFEMRIFIN